MKLKKLMAAVLSFSLVCGAMPFNNAFINDSAVYAEEEYTEGTYGPLSYTNYGDYIAITDCDDSVTKVEIPSEIDGVPVTWLEDSAFEDCGKLIEIDFPDSIEYFGRFVFKNTPWLQNKRAENPLVVVDNVLIDGKTCTGDVVIPEGVEKIASYAFSDCYMGGGAVEKADITSVIIPDTVTEIGHFAFGDCDLESITLYCNIQYFANPFFACSDIKEIYIYGTECELDLFAWSTGFPQISESGLTVYCYENSEAYNYIKDLFLVIENGGFNDALSEKMVSNHYSRDSAWWTNLNAEWMQRIASDFDRLSVVLMQPLGDPDGDGVITASDASTVLAEYAKIATGSETTFSEIQTAAADVNNDGAVDSSDASSILAYYAFVSTGGEGTLAEFLSNL